VYPPTLDNDHITPLAYQAYYAVQGYIIFILLEKTNSLNLTTVAELVAKCRVRDYKPNRG
jgi:hypothetical protein